MGLQRPVPARVIRKFHSSYRIHWHDLVWAWWYLPGHPLSVGPHCRLDPLVWHRCYAAAAVVVADVDDGVVVAAAPAFAFPWSRSFRVLLQRTWVVWGFVCVLSEAKVVY